MIEATLFRDFHKLGTVSEAEGRGFKSQQNVLKLEQFINLNNFETFSRCRSRHDKRSGDADGRAVLQAEARTRRDHPRFRQRPRNRRHVSLRQSHRQVGCTNLTIQFYKYK